MSNNSTIQKEKTKIRRYLRTEAHPEFLDEKNEKKWRPGDRVLLPEIQADRIKSTVDQSESSNSFQLLPEGVQFPL